MLGVFSEAQVEAFEVFKEWKVQVENETRENIKRLRTDHGGEFNSERFDSFCIEHGIFRQMTIAYSPQQNGVAERKNRINTVLVILGQSLYFGKMKWGERPLSFQIH